VNEEDDFGIDGFGVNASGLKCAVQVKYRSNCLELITYNDISKTDTSARRQYDLDLCGPNRIYVFTTSDGVTSACNKVFGKSIRVINKSIISRYIDNNSSFWNLAYSKIECTLLGNNS
jgi:hypothetical protein